VFRAVVALAAAPTLGLAVVLAFVLRRAPQPVEAGPEAA